MSACDRRSVCAGLRLTGDRWRESNPVLKGTANNRVRNVCRKGEMSDRAE